MRIAAGQRPGHLPWELVARDGSYLAVSESAALLPARGVSTIATLGTAIAPLNRPLRVLFMASARLDRLRIPDITYIQKL